MYIAGHTNNATYDITTRQRLADITHPIISYNITYIAKQHNHTLPRDRIIVIPYNIMYIT